MSIVTDLTKDNFLDVDSALADGDLTNYENCVVVPSAQSTGKYKVKAPTGQGVFYLGVLVNTTGVARTDGKMCEIVTDGDVKIKANGTFNAGIELAIHDTTGEVSAAATGDYVVGISREASKGANHLVSVKLTKPYQKN
jgi:hypothetical protein